ncbi:MAG: glycosyl transferase [Leptolyngbyaceae cyanobacterium bins.59]|nr:glycosyl transferase [Leptolyngbyaceae cyanobacterium bins.59]
MSRPVLYVAITNHGFGHATRTASLVAEIQRLNPDILIVMVTTAPRWLLESYIPGHFIHRPRGLDVGVVQGDSFQMDLPTTLEKLQQIQSQQEAIVAAEVSFIEQNQVGLILADIPPLAALIAKEARIPCWMVSNFGWDFIYQAFGPEFAEVTAWIQNCFSQCDRLWRLPFHEAMPAFPNITDVGLTGGTPNADLEEVRQKLGLNAPPDRTVLLTFGGLGLERIPYENVQKFPDWQFLTFDRHVPELPNLLQVSGQAYRPVDLMPLCGQVVCKPGFSTFAEAVRVGVPIVTLTRTDFAESKLLLEGIQDYAHHRILNNPDFFHGDWSFLREFPLPPRRTDGVKTDGNEVIARAIVDYFQSKDKEF